MRDRTVFIIVGAMLCGGIASKVAALINPNFTPVDLVEQSEVIALLELGPFDGPEKLPVRVVKSIKGEAPTGELAIDLVKTDKPRVDELRALFGKEKTIHALLFGGDYADAGSDPEGGEGEATAVLHVGAQWFNLAKTSSGSWILEPDPQDLQAVWAGGDDMLLRAVDYVLNDPDPRVPTAAEVSWGDAVEVAALTGRINGIQAIDLAGDGRIGLFVLADGGDRFLRYEATKRAFDDLTASLKLASKSRSAAWGDFNSDGRLDLVSWDGTALSLWRQTKESLFVRQAVDLKFSDGCIGLSVMSAGANGRVGILASTNQAPVLLVSDEGGTLTVQDVLSGEAGAFPGAELGAARACLAADFDGDALADSLQPFAKGALFYKGKSSGGFEPPKVVGDVISGKGEAVACTGDYDADGLLDVLVVGETGCYLWHNLGGGKFRGAVEESGEVAYITKPNAMAVATCDINNDGRQDLAVFYPGMSAQIFFNRGFRCFGYAVDLDLVETDALPQAADGQWAGTVADVNGDGAQDLVVALKTGQVRVLFRNAEEVPGLCARAVLPTGGPITVTGWSEERCLGAWNVTAGTPGAFLGIPDPGPLRLQWQLPGGKPQQKEVIVEDKPVRILITEDR